MEELLRNYSADYIPYPIIAEDEVNRVYSAFLAELRKGIPDYPDPMSTDDSVRMQIKVIRNVTMEDSGHLLSYDGRRIS